MLRENADMHSYCLLCVVAKEREGSGYGEGVFMAPGAVAPML